MEGPIILSPEGIFPTINVCPECRGAGWIFHQTDSEHRRQFPCYRCFGNQQNMEAVLQNRTDEQILRTLTTLDWARTDPNRDDHPGHVLTIEQCDELVMLHQAELMARKLRG